MGSGNGYARSLKLPLKPKPHCALRLPAPLHRWTYATSTTWRSSALQVSVSMRA
ncbi:MAG: hypothetical protein IPG92_05005 [Flavobacteriales bacterium]|nr:hypothetical protein [Flavobacteriales bacterium]